MKMKKVIAAFLTMAITGTMLIGCARDGKDVSDTGEAGVSGSLTIWEHSTSFDAALEAVIAGFNEKYPDVEVEFESKDGDTYYSLLTTAIQSGEAPDIFWTNGTATTNMSDLVENEALLELTDIVDYSALNEDSLYLGKVGDGIYSVPWMSFDTRCCYYNKDIFEKENWSIPKTFSEFEELLEKQKAAGYIPISLSPNSAWTILFAYEPILAAMDPVYTEGLADYSVKATDEPAEAAWDKMLEWGEKGYFGDNYMGVADGDSQILAFTTGKAAMNIDGSWNATTFTENNPELNLGAFQIPSEDGITGMVGTFANGFSVYRDSKNLEAAKAFINYCATLEAQTAWVHTLEAVSGSQDIEPVSEVAKEISDCDNTYTSWQSVLSTYVKEGESATTIWEEDTTKLFSGGVTTKEMMSDISEVMQ